MGYCITMDISDLSIKAKDIPKALAAINALHKDQKTIKDNGATGGTYCHDKRTYHYAWVDDAPEGGFKTLEAAFDAWRYTAIVNLVGPDAGDICVEMFNGEKMGNCDVLWKALAPFINPKAEIKLRGEDGALWMWVFKGGVFKELEGKVTYR